MAETTKTNQTAQSTKAGTAARSAGRSAASKASSAAEKSSSTAADLREKGAVQVGALASKAKAGGAFLSTVPAKSVQAATTAWSVIKHRKAIAASAGGGVLAGLAGAYALGRASARRGHGPITRWTGGRF
ncbi:hypothetical protein ABII15_30590 [Streptomyces sp. HUAS MG91]|uniref:Uncharacterized protein n=1 Tax=Streptomyces tabacisoli TaxID=3156398 RepID=A0AAU8J0H2_9ACTN